MNDAIYIDPEICLSSKKIIEVIMLFKTKPAKVQLASNESALYLQEAKQKVEDSHRRFREELKKYLLHNQVNYEIIHEYKDALNGVSIRLPCNKIELMLQSKEIMAIVLNHPVQLPGQPIGRGYQL